MRRTVSKYTFIEGHATSDLIFWAFAPCIKGSSFATMQCLHLQGNNLFRTFAFRYCHPEKGGFSFIRNLERSFTLWFKNPKDHNLIKSSRPQNLKTYTFPEISSDTRDVIEWVSVVSYPGCHGGYFHERDIPLQCGVRWSWRNNWELGPKKNATKHNQMATLRRIKLMSGWV